MIHIEVIEDNIETLTKVAIIKGTHPTDMTVKALELIEALDVLVENKPILIKPNYINARHPSTGITTDGRIIEGVIKFLMQHNKKRIIIGEGGGLSDTFKAYKVAGIDVIAEKWGLKLVDLNKDEFIEVNPSDPLALKRVKIAKMALNSTIISVPKLKLHGTARVSLSIKNMMGVMTPKGSMHSNLSKNIADLASIVRPSVSVIDGIIAGEGHETSGNPVEMNLVIAGVDPVAVDAVGASVMGVSPEKVKHLCYAEQLGLGTLDLENIEVIGEPIKSVQKKFRRSFSF